jgi:hypothetical protein
MADKKFLQENNLLGSYNRFNKLFEYSFYTNLPIDEAGDEEMPPPPGGAAPGGAEGGMPPAPGGEDPMGGGGMPGGEEGGMPPMGGGMPGEDPSAGGGEEGGEENKDGIPDLDVKDKNNSNLNNDEDPSAGGGEDPMGGEEGEDGIEKEEPDDNVIDVDDLTKAQDASLVKTDSLDKKMDSIIAALSNFSQMVSANDSKIEDLKGEIARRNPTEFEKMNIRSQQDSYPFSVKPKDYFDQVASTHSNYDIEYNNDVSPQDQDRGTGQNGEYVVRKSDVADANPMGVADTFRMPDEENNDNISNLMKLKY